jgi:hypothetical protein
MNMLQEENQKLKEFIQTMGDQMNKLTQKVEECQVVNLRSRQIDPVERPKRTKKTSIGNNHNSQLPDSQLPDSQFPDSQLPDTQPPEVQLESQEEEELDPEIGETIIVPPSDPIATNAAPAKTPAIPIYGSDKPPPQPKVQETSLSFPNKDDKKEKEKKSTQEGGEANQANADRCPFQRHDPYFTTILEIYEEPCCRKNKAKGRGGCYVDSRMQCNILKRLPLKCKDLVSFTIPCTIGGVEIGRAPLDLGASVNMIPLSIVRKMHNGEVKPTRKTLVLADRTRVRPYGILEMCWLQ